LLLVDEAHSIGVLGETGRGIGEHHRVDRADVDLWMGTMSKSLASCGGYVAGSKTLVNFLKYTAPGFVYSVGISPAKSAAALEALRQIQTHPEKVQRLHERIGRFLKLGREQGIDTGFAAGSAVVPAILGNSLHSLQVVARRAAKAPAASINARNRSPAGNAAAVRGRYSCALRFPVSRPPTAGMILLL